MAYQGGCVGVDQAQVGYDHRTSSMHLSHICECCAADAERNHRRGAACEGQESSGVFHGDLECRLSEDRNRESHADQAFRVAALHANHRAVLLRRSVAEKDVPLAQKYPPLLPTDVVEPQGLWVGSTSGRRDATVYSRYSLRSKRSQKERSKTFPGIARAMAEQWAGRSSEVNK